MDERMEREVWTVDPGASLQSVLDSRSCPTLVREGLLGVHSWQVRNETQVERTLRASQLMPQWMAALLALGARITLAGESGSADAPLEALVAREVQGRVTALHIPLSGSDVVCGEAHIARTASDAPIVSACAAVRLGDGVVEEARVALTGVWSQAVRLAKAPEALVGGPLSVERIDEVAAAVEGEVEPIGDYLGSELYRRAMAGVATRRALEACLDQEVADE